MVVSHRAILNRKVQMWLSKYQYKPFCTCILYLFMLHSIEMCEIQYISCISFLYAINLINLGFIMCHICNLAIYKI